jgi:hypothetical protein
MSLTYEKYADVVCDDVLLEIERISRHMRNWDMALHTMLIILTSASTALHGMATSNDMDSINHIGITLGAINTVTIGIIKFARFGQTHTSLSAALADLKAYAVTKTPIPKEVLRSIMKINTLCYKHPLVGVRCMQAFNDSQDARTQELSVLDI